MPATACLGASARRVRQCQAAPRAARVVARAREGIHPKLFKSKVIVNGETVDEITGTQEEYHVDVWSGNHPFYQGDTRALVLDEGQVNKFKARYAGLDALGDVATLSDVAKQDADGKSS